MEYEDVFTNNNNMTSEEIENCSNYIYAGEEQSHNASVKMLVTNKIVEFNGFDKQLIKHHNDSAFDLVIEESELVSGHILIGFKDYHAVVFVVISDNDHQWFESAKPFSYLENEDYKNISLSDLYRTHIRYLNQQCEEYKLEWKNIHQTNLKSYERLFYVCSFSDVYFLEIQAVALSSRPEYYSTFYSDCLEFCKTFAKNFINTIELDCVEQDTLAIDALAITGLKIEETSRKNVMSAVSGNRAVHSSSSGSIFVFFACVFGVVVGHIIMKLVDKFVFLN